MKEKIGRKIRSLGLLLVAVFFLNGSLTGCTPEIPAESSAKTETKQASESSLPDSGTEEAYTTVNGNVPYFTEEELTTEAFENYSELDNLGRCGVAYANICKELMPTEERGEIGMIKPSGWHTVKYDIVDGKYLYNRCHLIGYQLAGENANEKNLITGTRYLNVTGMLPFENQVADYVKETGNHVLYRVTPEFKGNNLVADGVRIEAESVEDQGAGVMFHVFCYNRQPGITIDYATGDSSLSDTEEEQEEGAAQSGNADGAQSGDMEEAEQILVHITDSGTKYHAAGCAALKKSDHEVTLEEAKEKGLTPCSKCNPPQ